MVNYSLGTVCIGSSSRKSEEAHNCKRLANSAARRTKRQAFRDRVDLFLQDEFKIRHSNPQETQTRKTPSNISRGPTS